MSCGSWSFGGWNYWNGTCWHWNYEVVGMVVAGVGSIGMGIVGAEIGGMGVVGMGFVGARVAGVLRLQFKYFCRGKLPPGDPLVGVLIRNAIQKLFMKTYL